MRAFGLTCPPETVPKSAVAPEATETPPDAETLPLNVAVAPEATESVPETETSELTV